MIEFLQPLPGLMFLCYFWHHVLEPDCLWSSSIRARTAKSGFGVLVLPLTTKCQGNVFFPGLVAGVPCYRRRTFSFQFLRLFDFFFFFFGAHHITPRMILEEDFLESLNVLSSALHPRTNRASSSIPVGHFRIACASQHLHVSCEHHHPRTTHRQRIHSFFTPFLITT